VTPRSFGYDTDRKCVGVIMAQLASETFLRPIGGGCEWSVERTRVRPATRTEVAAAKSGFLKALPPHEFKLSYAEPCTVPCDTCKKAGRQ
jgi:hypothetical protein